MHAVGLYFDRNRKISPKLLKSLEFIKTPRKVRILPRTLPAKKGKSTAWIDQLTYSFALRFYGSHLHLITRGLPLSLFTLSSKRSIGQWRRSPRKKSCPAKDTGWLLTAAQWMSMVRSRSQSIGFDYSHQRLTLFLRDSLSLSLRTFIFCSRTFW